MFTTHFSTKVAIAVAVFALAAMGALLGAALAITVGDLTVAWVSGQAFVSQATEALTGAGVAALVATTGLVTAQLSKYTFSIDLPEVALADVRVVLNEAVTA